MPSSTAVSGRLLEIAASAFITILRRADFPRSSLRFSSMLRTPLLSGMKTSALGRLERLRVSPRLAPRRFDLDDVGTHVGE